LTQQQEKNSGEDVQELEKDFQERSARDSKLDK
jgi:hypothetical protein